jgi:Domain of unknown function (DUF3291)
MSQFQIAQINIGRIKGVRIDDPIMKEFVDNLETVNKLAESSNGFVWRLKDENNNATSINPYNDEQIIINVSVWATIQDLEHFVYKTFHTDFLRRRKEWFQSFGKAYTAMWWVPEGQFPTIEEATEKLDYLQKNGPSAVVFDFKNKFPHP